MGSRASTRGNAVSRDARIEMRSAGAISSKASNRWNRTVMDATHAGPCSLISVRRAGLVQQKSKHGIGINLRLLDVCNMRGLEHGDLGAGNVLLDEFVAFERRRRIVPAGDDQSRRGNLRQ